MTNKELCLEMGEFIDSIAESVGSGARVTLKGGGTSMFPFIDERTDSIVLEKADAGRARIGEIYLYRRTNGRYAIHRIYRVNGDTVSMVGDSQLYIEKNVKKSDLLAIVTQVIKPGGTVMCAEDSNVRQYARLMKRRIRRSRLRSFLIRVIRLPIRAVKKCFRKE